MRQERIILGLIAVVLLLGIGYFAYPTINSRMDTRSRVAARPGGRPPDVEHRWKVVKQLYDLANAGRWDSAYSLLSPSYRRSVSLEAFRNGYRNFESVDADLTLGASDDIVHASVQTIDHDGLRRRTFAVDYKVIWTGSRWLINDKTSRVVADTQPQSVPSVTGQQRSLAPSSELIGCRAPTEDEILDRKPPHPDPNSAISRFYHMAIALDVPTRERIGRRVNQLYEANEIGHLTGRLFVALEAHCLLAEASTLESPTPIEAMSVDESADENMFWIGLFLAECAVEARGIADSALVSRAYAPFEPDIPMTSVHGTTHPEHWPS